MPLFPLKPGPAATHQFLRPRFHKEPRSEGLEIPTVAAAVASPLAEAQAPARLDIPSLISSAHGTMKRIFLTMPWWLFLKASDPHGANFPAIEACALGMKNLIRQIPDGTSLLILTHDQVDDNGVNFKPPDRLREWLDEAKIDRTRCEIVTTSKIVNFGIWAEDPYAISREQEGEEIFFVEPDEFTRGDDRFIADVVASPKTGLERTQVALTYQGGNILIGDEFWFLGKDYLNDSIRKGLIKPFPPESVELRAADRYREMLDRKRHLITIASRKPVPGFRNSKAIQTFTDDHNVVWQEEIYRGNDEGTVQPIFHIDMFLTLAGRDTDGRYIVLVGDPKLAADLIKQELPSHALGYAFDDIAEQLVDHGFRVIRNPLPLTYDDDEQNHVRHWYYASSNNALVEIDEKSKKVWLPTYGYRKWPELKDTDERTRRSGAGLVSKSTIWATFTVSRSTSAPRTASRSTSGGGRRKARHSKARYRKTRQRPPSDLPGSSSQMFPFSSVTEKYSHWRSTAIFRALRFERFMERRVVWR